MVPARIRVAMIRRLQLVLGLLGILASAATGTAAATTNSPSFFGLTNLWTLHLTVSESDWRTLVSRGVVRRDFGGGGGWGDGAPFADPLQGLLLVARPLHRLQHL